jgi:hypothetical protein
VRISCATAWPPISSGADQRSGRSGRSGRSESGDFRGIDCAARHHGVIDTCYGGDLRWNRARWRTQLLERISNGIDLTIEAVGERHHRQLDDLVPCRIKAGRLDIYEQA